MTFVNSTKTPSDGTFVERTSRNFLWCWLLFFISLLFWWCWLLLFLHFWATFPCHRHATLVSQACEGLHQLWALPWLLSIALLLRHIFTASATVLSGHFLPTGVFYLTLFPHIFARTCFCQGLPGSQQFFLEVFRASCWSSKHRLGLSVCLIHSDAQHWYSEEFAFKSYQILPKITCGNKLVYLLLTRFELFSLVQKYSLF